MGLLDMITGQKPKPGQTAGQPTGLLGMLGMDPNSTTFNVGAQLLANGLPTTKPFQMGAGIPEAIERSQTMQVRQQAVEQERADREAEAAQRKALAETVVPMMPANLQALAQVDPKSALAIWEQTKPKAADAQSLMNVGGGLIYDPNTAKWITPPEGVGTEPAVDFDDTTGIRKEVQSLPSYKNYTQALPIYRSMAETAGRDTKASDLNLVYGLGKIMDPTSVVREGEMVMVQNTASLPDWLVGAINSLNGGSGLTPETRAAIMAEAYGRVNGYDQAFQQDAQMYQGIADRYQIDPQDILPDFGTYEPWSPASAGTGPRTTSTGVPWSF